MLSIYERFPLPEIEPVDEDDFFRDLRLDINTRVRAMNNQINHSIRHHDFSPTRLASIEDNLAPSVSYAAHSAILHLLNERGLLNEYFEEENVVYRKKGDWEVRLERAVPEEELHEQIRFVSSTIEGSAEATKHRFTLWHRLCQ